MKIGKLRDVNTFYVQYSRIINLRKILYVLLFNTLILVNQQFSVVKLISKFDIELVERNYKHLTKRRIFYFLKPFLLKIFHENQKGFVSTIVLLVGSKLHDGLPLLSQCF